MQHADLRIGRPAHSSIFTGYCKAFNTDHHLKLVQCHQGMARPRVSDRGDGLQIWRAAANILNKQSRTADSQWPSSLVIGRGANNPPP
jgi:hypothetical protein